MISSLLQDVLMPVSFGSLLCLMFLYWGQAAFFSYTKYSKLTTVLFSFSFLSLTTLLILRWIDSGHFPLSNLYESLLFLSWSFLGIQLVAQLPLMIPRRSANSNSSETAGRPRVCGARVTVQPKRSSEKQELHLAILAQPMNEHDNRNLVPTKFFDRTDRADGRFRLPALALSLRSLLLAKRSFAGESASVVAEQSSAANRALLWLRSNLNIGRLRLPLSPPLLPSLSRSESAHSFALQLPRPRPLRGRGLQSEALHGRGRGQKGVQTKPDRPPTWFGSRDLSQRQLLHLLGVITSPMALLTYGFAFLNLPREMQKATALVPALQSNWLMMHVTIMILSYAALLCGSILSMVFLLLTNLNTSFPLLQNGSKPATRAKLEFDDAANRNTTTDDPLWPNRSTLGQKVELQLPALTHKELPKLYFSESLELYDWAVQAQTRLERANLRVLDKATDSSFDPKGLETPDLSLAQRLDNYSYRVLALGFPLLTVGILSGAVWANEAWGSYWSWDPKETWALITWLVFAIYLHARIIKGWTGQKPAIIATFGFFVVWFCYLGVNLLGTGLHSYGWFSN